MTTTTKKTLNEKLIVTGKLVATYYENDIVEKSEVDLSGCSGIWRDSLLDILYYLKKEEDEYYIILVFDDSSFHKKKVLFCVENNHFIFKVTDSPSGEFYQLLEDGILESWDSDGKIDMYNNVADL